MESTISYEDIFFACAVYCELQLEEISGVEFRTEQEEGEMNNVILVYLVGDKFHLKIFLPVNINLIDWVYQFLFSKGLWKKSEHTHH